MDKPEQTVKLESIDGSLAIMTAEEIFSKLVKTDRRHPIFLTSPDGYVPVECQTYTIKGNNGSNGDFLVEIPEELYDQDGKKIILFLLKKSNTQYAPPSGAYM